MCGACGGAEDVGQLAFDESTVSKVGVYPIASAIAKSNDRVYTWYRNGTVAVGTSSDLDHHQTPLSFELPAGYGPSDVVAIDINSGDSVYAWYVDGRMSAGTSRDLAHDISPRSYSVATGKHPCDLIDVAITSEDVVVAFYEDGTYSRGTSTDFDAQPSSPQSSVFFSGPFDAETIQGIGIASDDHVYAWYENQRAVSGTIVDLDRYRAAYAFTSAYPPPQSSFIDHAICRAEQIDD